MTENNNYWLFRCKKGINVFTEKIIAYGWSDFDISKEREEDFKQIREWSSKRAETMARKFNAIKQNDIVVLPLYKSIAIGRVTSEAIYREDLKDKDASNTYAVDWLCEYYPRENLTSALQSSLKYRGTFKLFWEGRYKDELKKIIDSKFQGLESEYSGNCASKEQDDISKIKEHISSREKLRFSPSEFEDFICELFEIAYPFSVEKNSQRKEKHDGKDFTASLDIDELKLNIQCNVQIKHHQDYTNDWAIEQISKSDNSEEGNYNLVVTSAEDFSESAKKKAKEKNVALVNASALAELIYDNFDKLDDKWKAKLGLYSSIKPF